MKYLSTFIVLIALISFVGCSQEKIMEEGQIMESVSDGYVGEIDSNYTDRNNYVKQSCIDQNIDNIWYTYIDDRIESETYEDYGWKNTVNDEIMVSAQYMMMFGGCFDNETMKGFAAVDYSTGGVWYWKPNGEKIIQIYSYNGPDDFKEGLSRYIENGKIGFINEDLEIVIPAQFDGAWFFKNGVAKVCNGCEKVPVNEFGEYHTLEGGIWGVLDKSGNVIWEE